MALALKQLVNQYTSIFMLIELSLLVMRNESRYHKKNDRKKPPLTRRHGRKPNNGTTQRKKIICCQPAFLIHE
jgi:hypothetical protein